MSQATKPVISLIAAVAQQRAIGQDNRLVWHCALDQQHFKNVTMGHTVIMGRKTWDSLPERLRPLPGRHNLVLTRDPAWSAPGAQAVGSFEQALQAVAQESKVYVMGGAQVYALALPYADELVITEIDAHFEQADSFFPDWDAEAFHPTQRTPHTDTQGRTFAFVTYVRTQRTDACHSTAATTQHNQAVQKVWLG
jgi:dihydrofolate reductase